jgi:3-hydroxy acid dehydrogenase/malonic semialdehyde reductase
VKALVVGGSSGFGRGVVEALLLDAWEVHVASRTRVELAGCTWVHTDVTKPEDMLPGRFPYELDLVVYSAGRAIDLRPIAEGVPRDWESVFAVNTLGLLAAIKATWQALTRTRGMFVHVGSIAATSNYAGGADYCASKAASSSIMRTLRVEALGTGVRTVSVEPGLGDTNFQKRRYSGDESRARKHYDGVRQLDPTDLGRTILWLTRQPPHVNFDEIVVKPLDQARHGLVHKSVSK